MSVAGELDLNAADRGVGQVVGHDDGAAAQIGERRAEHPAIADRHQILDARLVRLFKQSDGVGPIARRGPGGMGGARCFGAQGLALGVAFLEAGQCRLDGARLGGGSGFRVRRRPWGRCASGQTSVKEQGCSQRQGRPSAGPGQLQTLTGLP